MLKAFNFKADFWYEAAEFSKRPIQASVCYFLFLYFSSLFGAMGVGLVGGAREDADLHEMALQVLIALDRGLTPIVTSALMLWIIVRNIRGKPEFSIPRSIWFTVQCAVLCAVSMYYLFFGDGMIDWAINHRNMRPSLKNEFITGSGMLAMGAMIGALNLFICSIRKLLQQN